MENPIIKLIKSHTDFGNESNVTDIIKTIFDDQIHLSTIMMGAKPNYRRIGQGSLIIDEITIFIKYVNFITDLGWVEHTGDWDPYLTIEMENGTIHETGEGYYDLQLEDPNTFKDNEDRGQNETIYILCCDEDGEEFDLHLDPTKIKSITLQR